MPGHSLLAKFKAFPGTVGKLAREVTGPEGVFGIDGGPRLGPEGKATFAKVAPFIKGKHVLPVIQMLKRQQVAARAKTKKTREDRRKRTTTETILTKRNQGSQRAPTLRPTLSAAVSTSTA